MRSYSLRTRPLRSLIFAHHPFNRFIIRVDRLMGNRQYGLMTYYESSTRYHTVDGADYCTPSSKQGRRFRADAGRPDRA